MLHWYWIIGGGLTAWTFLSLLSSEQQKRFQAVEAQQAADHAAKAAALAAESAAKTSVTVVSSPKKTLTPPIGPAHAKIISN